MSRRKAKELKSSIQHLPAYKPPAQDRVTHSDVWARAMARWRPGTRVTVTFDDEHRRR